VASAFSGINLDNEALQGVYVGVVMGRHAGFLTAAAALGRKFPDDGPHLIYVPERDFEMDKFLGHVKEVYDRLGRCVIAVSEGIHDSSGEAIVTKLASKPGSSVERDAHGNVQLSGTGALADLLTGTIRDKLKISRVRGDTFGYLQRSFLGCVSDVDQREAREVGEKAVQYAQWAGVNGTVTIHRVGSYATDYQLRPLTDVAGKTKVMDASFITKAGNDVTSAFLDYGTPLLGSDMPTPERLRANPVAKILGA
jgi:6-phosphofructokinase 1